MTSGSQADDVEIRQALYREVRAAGIPGEIEMVVNLEVEYSGDAAQATSVRLVVGGDPRSPGILSGGRVVDHFVRGPGGRWELGRWELGR